MLVDGDKWIVLATYIANKFTRIASKYEVRYVVFGTFLIYIDNGHQFFEIVDEFTTFGTKQHWIKVFTIINFACYCFQS